MKTVRNPMTSSKSPMPRSILLLMLFALAGCAPAPDFTDVNGKGHRFADYADKWVIVNYWATWCGPCIKEIPELNELAARHPDRLIVLGVNFDEPVDGEALAQANRMKIEFPVFAGSETHLVLGVTKPEVLPTTFVFAPGMELAETLVGPQTEASLLAYVRIE